MIGRMRTGQWRLALMLWHLALPWCLFGCATTDDPHQGGFVSGVVGLASGGYEKRISDREHHYRAELDEQQRLIAEAEDLRRERARVEADLNQANRRLASMERRLRQARAQIAREQSASASAQRKLDRLDATEARVSEVRGRLNEIQPGERPVSELAAQSTEFDRELDELDPLVELVSGSGF